MFIQRHGSGPATILGIHGWSGDHRTFSPLLRNLPPEFSFWTLDLPGCGRSAEPPGWTVDAILNELLALVRNLPRPLHLVGNCSGALFGLELARRLESSPGAVAKITMIDAFALWPWYFRVFLAPGWGRYAYLTAFANPFGRWIANLSLAKRRTAATDLTEGFGRVNHASTYRYLQLLQEFASPERFQNVTCPVDILYGENSFGAIRQSVEIWTRVLPQARATMLPGAGHLPILEATAQLQNVIFEENSCLAPSTKSAR